MRIGLDFDNTLARYDNVFATEAKFEKLIPTTWKGSKNLLRDTLRTKKDGDMLWQKLQGRVYGPRVSQAEIFPGVAQFMFRCKHRGYELFIVSHKTEYGHYDPTETPLRKVALEWMTQNGFFKKTKFGLRKDQVFFENSRREKVSRIASLELDVFVDDLKEVYAEKEFPNIEKILFTTKIDEKQDVVSCNNWNSIAKEVLGPITDEDCRELAQTVLKERISKVKKNQGRGNSRIYQVITENNQVYALKFYPDLFLDPRNRLQTEVKAYRLLESLSLTPKVINFDEELNIAFFEWVEGEDLNLIENEHIDQALDFVLKLQELDTPDFFQVASEACTSADQLFSQIEDRLQQFEILEDYHLGQFLNKVFKPLYQEVREWSEKHWPANNLLNKLPKTNQMLSPSDFGFHNSLLRYDGNLCFLDFEYFGMDDPVKLIADFIWHPAMRLSDAQKKRWLEKTFKIFNENDQIQQRFFAAWPMYGLRWVMILLNEFRKDGWEKKIHTDENIEKYRKQILKEQIDKAEAVCGLINTHRMECPFV